MMARADFSGDRELGELGEYADVDEVDAYVRSVMQTALDRLGRERRFPILG